MGMTEGTATPVPDPGELLERDGDSERMAAIGLEIQAARRRALFTQAMLGAQLGTKQPAVSRWESGERDPGVTGLLRIAEACRVPASSLLPAEHQGQASLRAELEHARSALAGDSEGMRLWMLDCAALHARHRDRADAAEAKLEAEKILAIITGEEPSNG